MSAEFASSVQHGLHLTQRLFYGKQNSPPSPPTMSASSEKYLPASPMVYAVVPEPAAVDNPDVPSYQPYVHGRCDPPALIPLHMMKVSVDVDCFLDSAVVTLCGDWRLHCVMMSRKCHCRFALPLKPQDSILGVDVDISGNQYKTRLIAVDEAKELSKVAKINKGRFLDYQFYTFKLPKASGGSIISIKASWSQKLSYDNGDFCLNIPFSFPAYINPHKNVKKERIQLNVNTCTEREVVWRSTSHSLMELRQQDGRLSLLYEAQVPIWSTVDFNFSYSFSSSDMFGGLLLQSPCPRDSDQREMFCLYLFPGMDQKMKVFRKEVIFIIDISRSMRGKPLEEAKRALLKLVSELGPQDSFNIIAFNGEVQLFSSSMELATKGALANATQWINQNLLASGSTNILLALKQAFKLLGETSDSVPLIFLVTDGSVEDERDICKFVQQSLSKRGPISPRMCTLGIGLYCNHYFLRMLAQIGRGHYDGAYNTDSINSLMQSLFSKASSIVFANLDLGPKEYLNSVEMFPAYIPDLSYGSSLIMSGRYEGKFPETICLRGILADLSISILDVKSQKVKDFLLDKVLAKRQIDMLTADAWLTGSIELEEKATKMSTEIGIPSEYICMILLPCDEENKKPQLKLIRKVSNKNIMQKKVGLDAPKFVILGSLRPGFGNLSATVENLPPGSELAKPSQPTELLVKAASNCCGRLLDRFCCMCFIRTCSGLNDQCAIVFTQLCTALACFEWISCCCETCDGVCDCFLN